MASALHLFCLALDEPDLPEDDHIVDLRISPDWTLGDLQNALERHYPPYKGVSLGSIKVWALGTYLDEPTLLELDPATATTYNGVPLIRIEARENITTYFSKPFESNNAKKIHLIAKLHGQIKRSKSNDTELPRHVDKRRKLDTEDFSDEPSIPSSLLGYHRQFWGVPLDPMLTTPPKNDAENREWEANGLPGEPFLVVGESQFLVRAEYIRIFGNIKDIHEEDHSTQFIVLTGQPGIGKKMWILYALRRCLGEKQQVVLYNSGKWFLFSDSGVEIVNPAFHRSSGKYMWCFVDSEEAPQSALDSVCDLNIQLFPIYVTSPKKLRWERFEPQRNPFQQLLDPSPRRRRKIPKEIIMDPWNLQEIEKASKLYPERDLSDVRERFNEAAPTPQICFNYSSSDMIRFYTDRKWLFRSIATSDSYNALKVGAETLQTDKSLNTIFKIRRHIWKDAQGSYTVEPVTEAMTKDLFDLLMGIEEEEAEQAKEAKQLLKIMRTNVWRG